MKWLEHIIWGVILYDCPTTTLLILIFRMLRENKSERNLGKKCKNEISSVIFFFSTNQLFLGSIVINGSKKVEISD